jgi:hypothetical protein
MQYRLISVLLAVAALALGANAARAADEAKPAAKPATSTQKAAPKSAAAKPADQAKKPKRVDINSATVEQLAAVPGLDKAHAMKIVSNRPYPTRAWLVTKGILTEAKYAEVKDHLVATPSTSPKAPAKK